MDPKEARGFLSEPRIGPVLYSADFRRNNPELYDFYCPRHYTEDMSRMNTMYRGLLEQKSADMCSKLYAQRLAADTKVKEESLRAEGYSKLHEDLLAKVHIVTDKNHTLELELQRVRLDNANLKNQLSEAERRLGCFKSNLNNYSQEINVGQVDAATPELHGGARLGRS